MKKWIFLIASIVCAAVLLAAVVLLNLPQETETTFALVLAEPFTLEDLSGHMLSYDGEKFGGNVEPDSDLVLDEFYVTLPLDEGYTYTPSGNRCRFAVENATLRMGLSGTGVRLACVNREEGVLLCGEEMTFQVSLTSPALPFYSLVRISGQGREAVRAAPTQNGVAVSGMEGPIWLSFKTEDITVEMSIPELTYGTTELDFTRIRDGIITVTGEDGTSCELEIP